MAGWQVVGVISEADLLGAQDHAPGIPLPDPRCVAVSVRHGVVTLAGAFEPGGGVPADLARLARDVDGVVDVVCARP